MVVKNYRGHRLGLGCAKPPIPTPEQKQKMRARSRKKKVWRVFARDDYRCVNCGAMDDLTLDHIVPLSRGGTNSLDNLQTLCKKCNNAKGSQTMSEWLTA